MHLSVPQSQLEGEELDISDRFMNKRNKREWHKDKCVLILVGIMFVFVVWLLQTKLILNFLELKPKLQIRRVKIGPKQIQLSLFERLLERKPPNKIKLDPKIVVKELPFCFVAFHQSSNQQALEQTLHLQNYSNYEIVFYEPQTERSSKTLIQLAKLNQQIDQTCQKNSIVVFNTDFTNPVFLKKLNQVYQAENVWVSYIVEASSINIVSIYSKLLLLAETNNFTGTILTQQTIQSSDLAIDLISMSLDHLQEIQREQLGKQIGPLKLQLNQIRQIKGKYESLISMKQFSRIEKEEYYKNYERMLQEKLEHYRASFRQLKQSQMLSAIEYLQLLYLPANHSLADQEKLHYEQKYNFSHQNTEKPICVLIPSYNNIQDNRFERVIDSVIQQQYQNYHIVFIDDQSTDDTLKQTMKLVERRGFPLQKITFVQNLRKNFATYNIVNAAFNYCTPQDVLIIQDGDDELVGRQVFRLINHGYRNPQIWLMYTTFMTSIFHYGSSREITIDLTNEKRQSGHFIGQLRAFSVSLIRHIKLADHQCLPGQWLEIVYDDAIQHPLIEMAQRKHIEFLKEICYLYNVNYGNNDNSDEWKRVYRLNLYRKVILQRKPYQPLKELDNEYEDENVRKVLTGDYNIRYKNISDLSQIVRVQEQPQKPSKCKEYILGIVEERQNQKKK